MVLGCHESNNEAKLVAQVTMFGHAGEVFSGQGEQNGKKHADSVVQQDVVTKTE